MAIQPAAGAKRPGTGGPGFLALILTALLTVLLGTAASGEAWAAPGSTPTSAPSPKQATAAGATPTQLSWSVQAAAGTKPDARPEFTYQNVAPSTQRTDAVAVENFSAAPLTLSVYASDAYNTPTGGFDLLPAAQKPTDVGRWIHLDRSQVTVPARGTVIVPFKLTVPADATPGFHVGGIVASASGTSTDAKGDAVRVDRRVGMRVFLQVSGPLHPALSISGFTVHYQGGWNPVGAGTATVAYTVTNSGNVPLQARQTLRASGVFGVFTKNAAQRDLPLLLPGNSIRLSATIAGVWPGLRLNVQAQVTPYTSLVVLNPQPTTVISTTSTWATPWTWLIVVLLLIAALGAWRWSARRRRKESRGSAAKTSPPAARRESTTGAKS